MDRQTGAITIPQDILDYLHHLTGKRAFYPTSRGNGLPIQDQRDELTGKNIKVKYFMMLSAQH